MYLFICRMHAAHVLRTGIGRKGMRESRRLSGVARAPTQCPQTHTIVSLRGFQADILFPGALAGPCETRASRERTR